MKQRFSLNIALGPTGVIRQVKAEVSATNLNLGDVPSLFSILVSTCNTVPDGVSGNKPTATTVLPSRVVYLKRRLRLGVLISVFE